MSVTAATGGVWPTSDYYAGRASRASRRLVVAVAVLAVLYAALIVLTDGSPALIAPIGVVLVVGAIVMRPAVGLYLFGAAAALLEQFDLPVNTPITGQLHAYQNLSGFTPIPLRLSPVDLLVILTLASWAVHRVAARERPRTGPFALVVFLYLAAFLIGTAFGLMRGGFDENAALGELRGPFYVVVVYFLAADLIRERRQLLFMVAGFSALVTVKALQGIGTYATTLGSLDEVTGHEDVVFFNVVLALAIVAFIIGLRTKLAVLVMAVAPLCLLAELFTQRRVGYVGLALICVVIAALFVIKDPRRGWPVVAAGALAIGAYLPLFWNDTGALGQPIRAVRAGLDDSSISVRDQLSDRFRVIENKNIGYTMQMVPLTGVGVGQAYVLKEQPPRLPASFTFWQFITHNALLWLWLKAGPLGAFALWWLVARVSLFGAALWARLSDPELRWLATIPLAFILGQVIFSTVELGLNYSRTMILLGIGLGSASFLERSAP
jgi:hypothetical protein